MTDDEVSDAFLRDVLRSVETIAIVGASEKPDRPSSQVFGFLLARGYRVVGVNPGLAGRKIHGAQVFASLAEVPEPIDLVDIFRNSAEAGKVVDAALALRPLPRVIWMQLGVRDDEAAARARARGVKVVMNRCPKIDHVRLFGENETASRPPPPRKRSRSAKAPPTKEAETKDAETKDAETKDADS